VIPVQRVVASLLGWLQQGQSEAIVYLREENRILKAQLRNQRLRLTDDDRRCLASIGARLGRRHLMHVATIVTPDTILRWHRQLIARKWTYSTRRLGRPGVRGEIRRLVVRMATENPTWGYTRIQGALKNLGHRVARSTVATILKEAGHSSERRSVDVMANVSACTLARDRSRRFLHDEVWTSRGLVTFYTVFTIELYSRRVRILDSTPHPNEAFMLQIMRELTDWSDSLPDKPRVFLCDRDRKWSTAVRQMLAASGWRVIQTPFRAPNCNAHAERFVRSIKEECLDRLIPLGERHLRRALAEYVVHYHHERNHQGLGNNLIGNIQT
jgi:putative transposase